MHLAKIYNFSFSQTFGAIINIYFLHSTLLQQRYSQYLVSLSCKCTRVKLTLETQLSEHIAKKKKKIWFLWQKSYC